MRISRRTLQVVADVMLLGLVGGMLLALAGGASAASGPAGDLDQWANVQAVWQNGNLGNDSAYLEGDTVPFRLKLSGLEDGGSTDPNAHTVTVEWDTLKGTAHAYDHLNPYGASETVDPCSGLSCSGAPDSQSGVFSLWGGTITGVSITNHDADSDRAVVSFATPDGVDAALLSWGGHIAAPADHPGEPTAGDISGSPYHMRLIDVSGKGGNQDRSLSAAGILIPGISLDKSVSPEVAEPGDGLTYTFTITNTGELALGAIRLDDALYPGVTAPTLTEPLAPGDSLQVVFNTTVGADDLAGIHNVATAEGDWFYAPYDRRATSCDEAEGFCLDGTVSDTDDAWVDVAGIAIDKTVEPESADVGDTVTWTIVVTNTGSNMLYGVTLDDAFLGIDGLAVGDLDSGESWDASYETLLSQKHIPFVTNEATATGSYAEEGEVSATDDATVTVGFNPGMSLTKTVVLIDGAPPVGAPVAKVGQVVTYEYVITNTGDTAIDGVALVDDDPTIGGIDLTSAVPGTRTPTIAIAPTLPVDGTLTTTATHTVTADDLAGPLNSTGTATGSALGVPLTAQDDARVDLAHVTLAKDANVATASVGDTVDYTFTITNLGSVAVNLDALTDDVIGPVFLGQDTLAPGATALGSASHLVAEADLPGPIVNVGVLDWSVTDDDDQVLTSGTVQDDESVGLSSNPALTLTKSADVDTAGVGDTITYTYVVANNGDVTVSAVDLVDDVLGDVTLTTTTLAPGDTTTATATHLVTAADLPGPIVNVATATGQGPQGEPLEATASESVSLLGQPGIDLDKQANLTPSADGVKTASFAPNDGDEETVVYTYVITNTGAVPLTGVTLTDDVLGDIALDVGTLEPGASIIATATHTLTAADALAGSVTNVAVATATDPSGATVSDTDDEQVFVIEVLPLQGERQPPAAVAAEQLPRTGADSNLLLIVALLLLIEGAVIVRLSPELD